MKSNNILQRFLAVSFAIMLMLPIGAFADTIVNDVAVDIGTGTRIVTIAPGDSTTVNYSVGASNLVPLGDANGCNPTGNDPATATLNIPSGVTASASSIMFVGCGNLKPVTFSSNNPGTYIISISSMSGGKSGSLWNTTQATFTLNVISPDTTPPEITYKVDGTLGDNGWYISDVTVSWTVSDPDSAFSTTGCDSTTINTDTDGITMTCEAISAGGTSSDSITIKRDATAPTISGSASPAPNAAGWNKENVTVSFICSDATTPGSGLASCESNHILGEGADQSVTGEAKDNAGNTAEATVSNINIDKTAPIVSVTDVTNGTTYTLGSVPTAGCNTTDTLSGVATDATVATTGGTINGVGSFTSTCSGAVDNAGNHAYSVSVQYQVAYGGVSGILQPINPDGTSLFSRGRSVPVKFQLAGDEYSGFYTGDWRLQRISYACGSTDGTNLEDVSSTTPSNTFRYDSTADQYIYNADFRDQTAGSCWKVIATLDDGTTLTSAEFKLTK